MENSQSNQPITLLEVRELNKTDFANYGVKDCHLRCLSFSGELLRDEFQLMKFLKE